MEEPDSKGLQRKVREDLSQGLEMTFKSVTLMGLAWLLFSASSGMSDFEPVWFWRSCTVILMLASVVLFTIASLPLVHGIIIISEVFEERHISNPGPILAGFRKIGGGLLVVLSIFAIVALLSSQVEKTSRADLDADTAKRVLKNLDLILIRELEQQPAPGGAGR
ncbi:hypothetical protein [uncultured Jannaschia sp.]|uniref:hypothetical protein n=1 Tax=uncultured Jannaschia sp. TaxID=293347 RepID=UPI00263734DF|nr:hypothetical protein [uncultured Jannaschia sp.]